MKSENIKALESLSWVCHLTGLFSVFIGLVVTFMDVLNNDITHIQVGIYVFVSGYAFVKIGKKLTNITFEEKFSNSQSS